jgi:hypothetical protein
LIFGCEENVSVTAPKYSNTRIQEAKEQLQQIKRLSPHYPGLELMERILTEPDFNGVLKEWGCIAFFDDKGKLLKAYTLKIKDFSTGHTFKIRKYTESELNEAEFQILDYKTKMGIIGNYPIAILSESIKLAVAEALLNEESSSKYSVGRGKGSNVHELQVTKIQGTLATPIAVEALYATHADLP